jgi:hypothetical protein
MDADKFAVHSAMSGLLVAEELNSMAIPWFVVGLIMGTITTTPTEAILGANNK